MKYSALMGRVSLGIAALAAMVSIHARGVDFSVASSSSEAAKAEGGAEGGDIVNRIVLADGTIEYAHIFTNTEASATFNIPKDSPISLGTFRVLVVGGGGSGAGNCGGGGGAGGFVLDENRVLAPAEYTITVGKGGEEQPQNVRGNDGSDTTIRMGTTVLLRALGGGAGGTYDSASRFGSDGGSGGGGSCSGGNGGASTQYSTLGYGVGYAGGMGGSSLDIGGGGGGAGGSGESATSSKAGDGGQGVTCDITGESVVYAAGGGGGVANKVAAIGKGGGTEDEYGNGANSERLATPGAPSTGSGGGGGCGGGVAGGYQGGAAGSDGIVVIRYTIPSVQAQGSGVTVGDADGKPYYSYSENGVFKVRGMAKARVLAVGGGGAGGNYDGTIRFDGAGGGGGAGGMVELDAVYFTDGSYDIVVGLGGAANSVSGAPGENGMPSYIVFDDGATVTTNVYAYGGGGGGTPAYAVSDNAPGKSGGSGGGGSMLEDETFAGGASVQSGSVWGGWGSAGGSGIAAGAGAGGGGAGGVGSDADTENTGAAGGSGRISSITGVNTWYAAGGGGGSNAGTGGAGGSSIGGSGAGASAATDGVPNRGGGGGGGGSASVNGGAGGSGVIVIRVEAQRNTLFDKPAANLGSVRFDGTRDYCLYADYDPDFQDVSGTIVTNRPGTYRFKVSLKPGLCWSDGTTDTVTCTWRITKQTLNIKTFSIGNWLQGQTPSTPALDATPTLDAAWFRYDVSSDGGLTWAAWSAGEELPSGTYKARLVVYRNNSLYTIPGDWFEVPADEGGGYTSYSLQTEFSVIDYSDDMGFPEYLGYHTVFAVTKDPGETLTNFPMLVHISDATIPGIYRTARSDFSDVRFTFPGDPTNQVPFEIDTFNPDGETLIWVKMPEYKLGAQVVMNWGELSVTNAAGVAEGVKIPAVSSESVWGDYTGVWHFNEDVTAAEAASKKIAVDATVNHNDAVPYCYSETGYFSAMVSEAGVIGNARVNGKWVSNSATDNANQFTWFRIDDFENARLVNSAFTFSGWIRATQYAYEPIIISTKTDAAAESMGWHALLASDRSSLIVAGTGANTCTGRISNARIMNQPFIHVTIVFDNDKASLFAHGSGSTGDYEATDMAISAARSSLGLAFGGNLKDDGNPQSLWGSFDEFRLRKGAMSAAWAKAEFDQAVGACAPGLVYVTKSGTFLNRWLSAPEVSSVYLEAGGELDVDLGEALYGAAGATIHFESIDGTGRWDDAAELEPGSYILVIEIPAVDGARGWSGLERRVSMIVGKSQPVYSLGDEAAVTRLGRILLANDDTNPTQPVAGQSYYFTDSNVTGDNATYWIHEDAVSGSAYPHLNGEINHVLMSRSPIPELCGATAIWRLYNVRIGNTYTGSGSDDSLAAEKNYLPQSKTAKAVSENGETGSRLGSAFMALRNANGAAIYSPCYTNGIGTIYFDAVNSGIVHTDGDSKECFSIEVQICTNSLADSVHEGDFSPTDTNISSSGDDGPFSLGDWKTVEISAVKFVNGTKISTIKTEELVLDIESGRSDKSFYRVFVDADASMRGIRQPARFRIVRKKLFSGQSADEEFVLIDNIEVSPPPSRVDLVPLGDFDPSKNGSRVTGWSGAFEPAFPSIHADAIYARMGSDLYASELDSDVEADDLVVSAAMHYRWRYLNQSFYPADGSDWNVIELSPSDGFRSTSPLDVPKTVGDIEFWTEILLNSKYYNYCDYTGLNLGVPGYTEQVGVITNRCAAVGDITPITGGSDWFVRIRDGASEWEAFALEIIGVNGATNTYYASMDDDATWRCYYRTLTNKTGTVSFRIKGFNHQTDGSETWTTNTTIFAVEPVSAAAAVGRQGILTSTFSEALSDDDWCEIPIDAESGYILFQLDERAKSVTIVHADYQNFNQWSDSASSKFRGSYSDGNPVAGTANNKQKIDSDFTKWKDMPVDSEYWVESFTDRTGTNASSTAISANFITSPFLTPNGWTANNAKIIYETFNSGDARALQLRGDGQGYIQYVNSGDTPRGIDTLSFTARLASSIEWDTFSYCNADGMISLKNYTFATGVRATDPNDGLKGAYAVSLVANYRDQKGCYEFRYVQHDVNQGRLELWKWARSGSKIKSYFLGSGKWTGLGTKTGITSSDDNWATMAISVTNMVEGVKIVGAINSGSGTGGAPSHHGGSSEHGTKNCHVIEFLDTGLAELGGAAYSNGTFGVSSANCPAIFYCPRYYKLPLDISNAANNNVNGKDATSKDGFCAWGYAFDVGFPPNTKDYEAIRTLKGLIRDGDDIVDYEDWALSPGRMIPEVLDTDINALKATPYEQELGVFLATAGSASFGNTPVTNVVVSSFLADTTTMSLRTIEDCSLCIRVTDVENPTEVVIDDLKFTQWRGEDWDKLDSSISGKPSQNATTYSFTNFTFTSCWTTNNTVLLSPRRTAKNAVCSIVSPLFDGWAYRTGYTAGSGLGQLSFEFEGAQTNARVCVQIMELPEDSTQGDAYSYAKQTDGWTTIETFTFDELIDGVPQTKGVRTCYIGKRGVHGLIRLAVDPSLVNEVAGSNDPEAFGDIYIKSVSVWDEPAVDYRSWWGWNMRTLGDQSDTERRMLLGDMSDTSGHLSLALNNSVFDGVDDANDDSYRRHLPFVQTPTFTSNLVGAVTFKARKYAYTADDRYDYEALNAIPAIVTLYGSTTGDEYGPWTWLKDFQIDTPSFTNLTYTTSSGQRFKAFRIAIRGVDGVLVEELARYSDPPEGATTKWSPDLAPVRVILDEVAVTEAIRPRVGFRNVGAFRSELTTTAVVPNVPSESEQPLCKEGWGVQCEIYKAQLPDLIDLDSPEVYLHWYNGEEPWGYDNWKTNSTAKTNIKLVRADAEDGETEQPLIFRSSYSESATIIPDINTNTVVQYMLEVRYTQYDDEGGAFQTSDYLEAFDWPNPEWYRPVDLNAEKDSGFSAYTILDYVAPHWAWINEVNILGSVSGGVNTDLDCQFVEIAAPAGADLTDWYLQFLTESGDEIVTNKAAIFGQNGLSGTKDHYVNSKYGMTFRVIGSPESDTAGTKLKYSNGTLDGVWSFEEYTTVYQDGEIRYQYPIAVQLVRPRGILESEIVAVGSNYWEGAGIGTSYGAQYHASNVVSRLNAATGANFVYIGNDCNFDGGVDTHSISAIDVVGGSYACWTNQEDSVWTNNVTRTPGRINVGETIEGKPPTPGGMSRLIFSNLIGSHITQRNAESEEEPWTANDLTLWVQRNVGTNIVYRVDKWHMVKNVTWTEAGSAVTNTATAVKYPGTQNDWVVNVGTNREGNITVTAQASPDPAIQELLGENNRYRDAIMDWLVTGKTLYGREWEGDEIHLAEFRTLNGTYSGDLTLTEMYWLDIPPTVPNMRLVGGMYDSPKVVNRNDQISGDNLENVILYIKMFITNATDGAEWFSFRDGGPKAWAPYVIQGMQPGYDGTSWKYLDDKSSWSWTNATFKIRGKLMSLAGTSQDEYWVSMRKFVFDEDSFDENFQTRVEVLDYRSPKSPAYVEWFDWMQDHPNDKPFYFWALNDSTDPTGVQLLTPTNTYGTVEE